MKRFTKMLEQAPLKGFVQSCLSLTAFTILGFTAVEPVNAASLHTGFASYAITDLGQTNTYGITNSGQVLVSNGVAGVWENGQITEIKDTTWAYQMNSSGQVVGRYLSQNWTDNAYLWQNGQRTDLGYFGGISSKASDINEAGQIVGTFNTTQEKFNPFLWQNGEMIDLGTLGFNGGAQGINNQGQVVGYSGLAFGITHAFQWENGQMIDLGTLPGYNGSIAYDINDAGQAIGYSSNSTLRQSHATLWSNGQITDLGTLGGNISAAVDINNKGQVVGLSNTITGDGQLNHGFIWEDGQMADLNSLIDQDSGWFLQEVSGINDRGQIVGKGINRSTGQNHGFLLNPICGTSQRNPLLPDNFEDGWHSFSNVANRLWFDPPTSAGFTFKIGDDLASGGGGGTGDGCIVDKSPIAFTPNPTEPSLFTKILGLPSGIDADELFSVLVGGKEIGKFKPNEVVDFVALLGYGVSEFRVAGIDAAIDPKNPLAFPIKLESNRDKFSFKMRADSAEAVPEPSEIAGLVTSAAFLAGLVLKRKRKLAAIDLVEDSAIDSAI